MSADESPRRPTMRDLSPGYLAAREREARINRALFAAIAAAHLHPDEHESDGE